MITITRKKEWLLGNVKGLSHGNFSCNLQRNSTLKRCKFVTNVWYVKNILANCDGNLYLPILHLPRVELHCKLQEKLHRVTGPLDTEMLIGNFDRFAVKIC